MDTNQKQSQQSRQQAAEEPTGTPEVPTTVPDLTITKQQQLADAFLKSLAELSATLPIASDAEAVLAQTLPNLNVRLGFLAAAIAAVAETPELQALGRLDVNSGRAALQLIDAWTPVLTSVEGFARRLRFTISWYKSPVATQARSVYAVSKGLVKGVPNSPLVPHVQAMKTGARFSRGRRKEAGNKTIQQA